jgi:DNA repair exonuclease SbcCD nuclease subunit
MDRVPKCRSESQEEWLDKQLTFLNKFSKEINPIIAGDVFDVPERNSCRLMFDILNVIEKPIMAIAGNHDTPLLNNSFLDYSSYGILRKQAVIKPIDLDGVEGIDFVSDTELAHKLSEIKPTTRVVVIHRLICNEKLPHMNELSYINNFIKLVPKHVELLIAGDNHKRFISEVDSRKVLNCGSVHRITAAQVEYQPCYYRIYDDLTIEPVEIDCSGDLISREYIELEKEKQKGIQAYIDSVSNVTDVTITTFSDVLKERVRGTNLESYVNKLYESIRN